MDKPVCLVCDKDLPQDVLVFLIKNKSAKSVCSQKCQDELKQALTDVLWKYQQEQDGAR